MKTKFAKPFIPLMGIVFILSALMLKRLSLKNLNIDSILVFFAGIILFLVFFLIVRMILKVKK